MIDQHVRDRLTVGPGGWCGVALPWLGDAMKLAEIVRADGSQMVRLPEGFHLDGDAVSIRRQGEAIVLEPIKPTTWPPEFFDRIRIDDPALARPSQGSVPPAPQLD